MVMVNGILSRKPGTIPELKEPQNHDMGVEAHAQKDVTCNPFDSHPFVLNAYRMNRSMKKNRVLHSISCSICRALTRVMTNVIINILCILFAILAYMTRDPHYLWMARQSEKRVFDTV